MTESLPRRPRVLGSPRSVALAKEGVPPEWEPGCGTPRRRRPVGRERQPGATGHVMSGRRHRTRREGPPGRAGRRPRPPERQSSRAAGAVQSSQVRACPGFRFSLTPRVVRALSAARVPGRTRAAERDRPGRRALRRREWPRLLARGDVIHVVRHRAQHDPPHAEAWPTPPSPSPAPTHVLHARRRARPRARTGPRPRPAPRVRGSIQEIPRAEAWPILGGTPLTA